MLNRLTYLLLIVLFTTATSMSAKDMSGKKTHQVIQPKASLTLASYSPGVIDNNGTLYVSGQIAYVNGAIPKFAVDGKTDMADQAKLVMENIGSVIRLAGYRFDDAVKVSVFMVDINDYAEFNEVYATYWPKGTTPPAREAMQVAALPGSKQGAPVLVEVSMILQK